MKNKSYIGISFIILIFGIIFIPRIIDRIKNNTVTTYNRVYKYSNSPKDIDFHENDSLTNLKE